MAIPPIISNNPLLKLLRLERSNETSEKQDHKALVQSQTPQDIVEISAHAQERLNGVQALSVDEPKIVQETAEDTRDILAKDEALTLGADPAFDA